MSKKEQVMHFIEQFWSRHQYPPTIREIQKGCNMSSTSVVFYFVQQLEKEGYVTKTPGIARGIKMTKKRMFV